MTAWTPCWAALIADCIALWMPLVRPYESCEPRFRAAFQMFVPCW